MLLRGGFKKQVFKGCCSFEALEQGIALGKTLLLPRVTINLNENWISRLWRYNCFLLCNMWFAYLVCSCYFHIKFNLHSLNESLCNLYEFGSLLLIVFVWVAFVICMSLGRFC